MFRKLIYLLFAVLLYGCEEEAVIPTVETTSPTSITVNSAIAGGNILNYGGAEITSRGVCWSTDSCPDITDNMIEAPRTNPFKCTVTDLSPNTEYWVRSYATNKAGTGYGTGYKVKTWYGSVMDIDKNTYNSVLIGSQLWLAENLKVTRLNDGTEIEMIKDSYSILETVPWYTYYHYEIKYRFDYGSLYNWYAVLTGKLCPSGWHVSTDDDWDVLVSYLGETTAGSKLKATGTKYWNFPNEDATNESGFTALPGGMLTGYPTAGNVGVWWAVTGIDDYLSYRMLSNNSSQVFRHYENLSDTTFGSYYKYLGYSVRCVKDSF